GAGAVAWPRRMSPASCQRDRQSPSSGSCCRRRCRKRASSSASSPSNSADSCSRVWSMTLSVTWSLAGLPGVSVIASLRTIFDATISRVHEGPQLQVDRLAGAEDARTHRADRAIHLFCDLLVAQAVDLAQRDCHAQLL